MDSPAAALPVGGPLRNDNPMKLGVFAMNCKGGTALTRYPRGRIVPTWEQQVSLARTADEAGWEFLLPLGRWRGLGGDTDPVAAQFEVFTWAAGITASTSRIHVLATVHTALFEPLVAAKQAATIDHIGGGRFGLNIVAGWNQPEMAMFGKQIPDHHARYAQADEWTTLVRRLWSETEEFDFAGDTYSAQGAYLSPRPVNQPVIVQAGLSPDGMAFAAKHADYGFQSHPDIGRLAEMGKDLRRRAEQHGREPGVLVTAYVVCADTEAEARRFHDHYVDELGDFAAARNLVDQLIGGGSRSWPAETYRAMVRGMVASWGAYPLVGTPEMIVEKLVELHSIGVGGVGLSWVDYQSGIRQFDEKVVPLMVDAGLRRP
ncbi:LLM class flavin-dependent oxidoreductase [Pseudonocardia sp.]|uniref:LLM class flavin-dependent oxidoreductase n=1 Tax=Pseudonocardia sp. TaxID=60912 RepID=UPI003D095CB0